MTAGRNSVDDERLKSFVERIERLHEERTNLGADISDVFKEAKGVGFDVKALRKVLQLRRMDPADRQEHESLVELYMGALGT